MEYRSSATLLGLPLVHVAVGGMVDGRYRRGIATGWIAIGDVAIGALFAIGGVAIGGISLGGAALGLLAMGGASLGVLALGGLEVGVVALGGGALAWYVAIGGLAIARDYALGGLALARHTIAPSAPGRWPFSSIPHPPFRWSDAAMLLMILTALLIVAVSIQQRRKE
jgi:hypothetical protein